MSYSATNGYGRGFGFGGGAKILYFSSTQLTAMSVTAMYQYLNVGVAPAAMSDTDDATQYQYMNVGVAPAAMDDTDDATQYQYMNVGVAVAPIVDTGDATQYQYKNVQDRPPGSSEDITPTMN